MFDDYEEHLNGLNERIKALEEKCLEKDSHIALMVEALRTVPSAIMSSSRGVYYCPSCERVWDQRSQMTQPHKENCAFFRAVRVPNAKSAYQVWKQRLSDQFQKGIDHCRRRHQEEPRNTMVSNEAQQRLDKQIRDYQEAESRLNEERDRLYRERLLLRKKAVNHDTDI